MLTLQQLQKIMPNAKGRAIGALPILNKVAAQYEINTERRMAMWLATLAAESGELKYQEEIASGSAYEGRKDLGNTQKGDGRRFKGHGRIQITGRDNHTKYTNYLKRSKHLPFVDFVANPERLAEEPYATDAAGWFWTVYKGLNKYADKGDFLTTQVRVNGRNRKTGLPNHYDVRQRYYARGLSVLPDGFTLGASTASLDAQSVTSTETTSPDTTTEPQDAPNNTVVEQTTIEQTSGGEVVTTATSERDVVIESREPQGFLAKMWKKVTGLFAGNTALSGVSEYASQVQAFGLSASFWEKILWLALGATVVYLLYEGYVHWQNRKEEREKDRLLASVNSSPNNIVMFAHNGDLKKFEEMGYKIIRRK